MILGNGMTALSDEHLERDFESRLAARKKWCDRKGEIHPLSSLAIIYGVLLGLPLLASMVSPWAGAFFRWLLG